MNPYQQSRFACAEAILKFRVYDNEQSIEKILAEAQALYDFIAKDNSAKS